MTHDFATSGLSDALVILGAAGIVIPTFARFRISPVIGFILVGMLVGPAGFGAMTDQLPWLNFVTISNPDAIAPFAEFGIILLLFSIGLELSFRRLWGMRRLVFGLGASELLISAAIIGVAVHMLGQGWTGAVALGLALALSSTAVVLPMVGTTSPVGRAAFAMLLFEDLALVPIAFLLGALGPRAQHSEGLSGLLTTVATGALLFAIMLAIGRYLLPRLFAQAARTKSPEMFLSISLLVVIASSLATAAVGLSPIVGALIAGILIAETEYHGEVEVMTAPLQGLGLGVFLITVGMRVDIRTIVGNWAELVLALVGVMLVKTIVTALLLRLSGKRKSVAAEASLLMASPSETTLIVIAAAGVAGLISEESGTFWTIVTAMGLTLTPLLAKLGRDVARRIDGSHSDSEGSAPSRDEPRAVIIGFGRVGRLVAEMLTAARSALCRGRFRYRRGQAGPTGRLPPDFRRRLAARAARPAQSRPCQRPDPDHGRSRPGGSPGQEGPRLVPRPHHHRPCPRPRARRRAVQGRRHRRRAGDARILAATVRSGARRSRHGDGPGHRLDPRETRRVPPADHGARPAQGRAAAAGDAAEGCRALGSSPIPGGMVRP